MTMNNISEHAAN